MAARKIAAHAIEIDDFVTAEHYVEQCDEEEVNIVDENGETLLHKAARKGNSQCIIKLVQKGADVTKVRTQDSIFGYEATNALLMALGDRCLCDADYSNPKINKLTSKAYAALIHPSIVNWTGSSLFTPLHRAAKYGIIAAIQELVKAGADPARESYFRCIPLEYFFHRVRDNECSNSEAIFPLIPQSAHMDPFVIVNYIDAFDEHLTDPTHDAEVLARMLLSTRPDDYFSLHLPTVMYTSDHYTKPELVLLLDAEHRMCYSVKFDLLYPISVLLRKGLGAQTSPQSSPALDVYRAEGEPYPGTSTVEESNVKYEEAAEKAKEIDALFAGPLSLFDQCCITVRRSIQIPKHDNLPQLPLPPLVLEQVTLLSLCREFLERIHNNR